MKEALFYKKLKPKEKIVQCQLCPHFCVLKEGKRGKCGVRENRNGKLISLVYGKPCSTAVDAIEKKPLYHFWPGTQCLSIATVGCNLFCLFCQNWEISHPEKIDFESFEYVSPKKIIEICKQNKLPGIAYTYTEPAIYAEYALDCMKLARKEGLYNVWVSNGYINPKSAEEISKYLDAINVDLKGDLKFYQKLCGVKNEEPMHESLKIYKKNKVWIEITNLIIPGYNDKPEQIRKLVSWVKENLGTKTPLHFSAFYPTYKLLNLPSTPLETLNKARKIALDEGIKYVYTGNLPDEEGNNTYCPKCKEILIKRRLFSVIENKIKRGKCFNCREKIAGIWN